MLGTFAHHAGKQIIKYWNILNVLQHVPIHIKIDFQKFSNLLIRKMKSSIFFSQNFVKEIYIKNMLKLMTKNYTRMTYQIQFVNFLDPAKFAEQLVIFLWIVMVAIHEQVKESNKYNFEHCRIPVNDKLNFNFMRTMLRDYSDIQVCDLFEFGFPIGFEGDENSFPRFSSLSKIRNHKGAVEFTKEINNYLEKESFEKTILGPFKQNPFSHNLILSPLNSLPKKNTEERRVILDLSHPKSRSINDFIDKDFYLGHQTNVVYPKVDDMVELVQIKGKGCLLFKKNLRRAYRRISICHSDYNLVAFSWGKHIFCDTVVLSMGLKSAAAICQRVSNAITFMLFQLGFSILNYLHDLAGAETAERAEFAYNCLG